MGSYKRRKGTGGVLQVEEAILKCNKDDCSGGRIVLKFNMSEKVMKDAAE